MAESRRKVGLFHYSTAAKMFNNYLKNGSFEEAERSGRLMESNEKDRLQNRRWLKNGNTLSLEKMKVLFDSFSKKNYSRKHFEERIAQKRNYRRSSSIKNLSEYQQRALRLNWARTRKQRSVEQWSKTVFSDECRFGQPSDGRVYVWRVRGKRYAPESTTAHQWFSNHGIIEEDWSTYSPDLSPIEKVWAYMKRQLRSMKVNQQNLQETVFSL